MQQLDRMAEQRDAAGTSVVAGIAIFEGIDTTQLEVPLVVARQAEKTADDSFVEKLQAFLGACLLCRMYPDFTGFEGIKPEPDAAHHQGEGQKFVQVHGTSIRKTGNTPQILVKIYWIMRASIIDSQKWVPR